MVKEISEIEHELDCELNRTRSDFQTRRNITNKFLEVIGFGKH